MSTSTLNVRQESVRVRSNISKAAQTFEIFRFSAWQTVLCPSRSSETLITSFYLTLYGKTILLDVAKSFPEENVLEELSLNFNRTGFVDIDHVFALMDRATQLRRANFIGDPIRIVSITSMVAFQKEGLEKIRKRYPTIAIRLASETPGFFLWD